jgi:hypothetical protein
MRKIMKGAIVLLIAVTMVFSTVAVTGDTYQDQFSPTGISGNIKNTEKNNFNIPNINVMKGPTLFLQSPSSPDDWYAWTSDINSPYVCLDNFWDVTDPICDLHWWGLSLLWTGYDWVECDPEGMLFDIYFFTDNGGVPGNQVCTYYGLSPAYEVYDYYDPYTCYKWSILLEECCPLTNGWVAIAGYSSPNDCWFLWMTSPDGDGKCVQYGGSPEWKEDDLAFELTGEEICNPDIDVEKEVFDSESGRWVDADTQSTAVDAPICSNIQFRIKVTNTGDCPLAVGVDDKMHDSLKYVSADPEPEEVTYDPPFYYILWVWPTWVMPGETITITVTAHVEGPECSYDYNYAYALGTTESGEEVEDEDYAYVHAYEKARNFNNIFLQFLLRHPNLFPTLQFLLQKFGLS